MSGGPGLGGVFLRVEDPKAMYAWYEEHLGLQREGGLFQFPAESQRAPGLLSFFKKDSAYFPVEQPVMLNLQVGDLRAVLERLRAAGVTVEGGEDSEFGAFGWFTDPEGNRVELWQPPSK